MTLIIITVSAIIIWKWYRRQNPHHEEDSLGGVVGHATHYAECPICGERDCQDPRGRGEVITRGGHYVVRQYHICVNCNSRALWHRRLDQFIWTVNRSGVHGIPYHSHG